ncbi:MAG: PA14 domain-containing protein, partial [Chloroflexota bacterium]
TGSPGATTVRVALSGDGAWAASPLEQAAVAGWAREMYARLLRRQLELDLVLVARAHLAARLAMAPDQIQVISFDAVTWEDVCLGMAAPGKACEPYPMPGLRIVFLAGDSLYEYRTDLLGLMAPYVPATPTAPPTATPSLTPTATPAPPTATFMPAPTATQAPIPTATPLAAATPVPTATPVAITDWRGEYYANDSLAGAPALVRNDYALGFNWGDGPPAPGLPADGFSVRWSRLWRFSAGVYRFYVFADDGVRLWVAGNLILDRWYEARTQDVVEVYIMDGTHEITVEYFEARGLAEISVWWERLSVTPTPTWEPYYADWRGAYYGDAQLSGSPVLVRSDAQISFNWGNGAPHPAVPTDYFSVRWTRRLYLPDGLYRFVARADDGIRVRVNNTWVIDQWRIGGATTFEGTLWLDTGDHDLLVEYFENVGLAEVSVTWERAADPGTWYGEYFPNRNLEGAPAFARYDAEVAFDWREGSPGSGVPNNDFSVRWTRVVNLEGGRYRFTAHADDGVRVYLNGNLLIDEWREAPGQSYVREIDLAAGSHRLVGE